MTDSILIGMGRVIMPEELERESARASIRYHKDRSLVRRVVDNFRMPIWQERYTVVMSHVAERFPERYYQLTAKLGFPDYIYHTT